MTKRSDTVPQSLWEPPNPDSNLNIEPVNGRLTICLGSNQLFNLALSLLGSNQLFNLAVEGPEGGDILLTYEHLQSIIESYLVETGYYEVQGAR